MSRTILIVNRFSAARGETELLVDYAIDEDSGKTITVPNVNPKFLGATFDEEIGEWIITNK